MIWKIRHEKEVGLENILDILLENRGLNLSDLKQYTLKDLVDPYEIYDMEKAVLRIKSAIQNKEKIFIHGDFDVDGTAATAILWSYLYRIHSADVMPFIPHRVDEGYGMSKHTIDKLIDEGAELIISVDCGIKDIELVEYAKTRGVDIIISDHHEFVTGPDGNPRLPDTIVIHGMHPKSKFKEVICGGVTAWKIICALEKEYTGEGYTEVSMGYIDLAAITTLSDIMPLKDENRVIVSLGLEQMRKERRLGIDELCKVSGIDPKDLNTYHIGFMLGPRLNAPGRVENSAMNSLRLLCTSDKLKAQELSAHLDQLNKKRQEMTEKYINQAISQIEYENGRMKDNVIFAYGDNWPEGIVGLVAGKITERYYRPAFIMSNNLEEKKVTGSARSIKNFHLVKALNECSRDLERYGGHAMAAGYALKPENINDFKSSITAVANKVLSDDDLISEINIDTLLSANALDLSIVEQVEKLSPFGYGNTTPVFASRNVKITNKRLMGNLSQHVKFTFLIENKQIDGIAFNASDAWRLIQDGTNIDVAYTVDINEWNGRKNLQLMIKDIKY